MLILTGPTAAGKNTVAHILAQKRERCAVVDFDSVRKMFVEPHRPPWAGEEGRRQQMLAVEMASSLAAKFAQNGWEVVILDVLEDHTVSVYKDLLKQFSPAIVQLLPAYEILKDRFNKRGPVLTAEELDMVYKQQENFKFYDTRIDNTSLSPEETAGQLASSL